MDNTIIVNVDGKPISNVDVIVYLKENSFYKDSIQELIKTRALQSYAGQNNLTVTDDELQEFVNSKRKALGLISSQSTQAYLSTLGITTDQWINSLETECLKEKISNTVITDAAIERYFNENKLQFVEIELYKIVCDNKDTAEEILMEIRDDKKDFFELARTYSIDTDTRPASGYTGRVKRGKLPLVIEQKVFTSDENTVFGPVQTGDTFTVFFVGTIIQPELTDSRKTDLRTALFKMWLSQLVQSMRIDLPAN